MVYTYIIYISEKLPIYYYYGKAIVNYNHVHMHNAAIDVAIT